MKVLEYIDHLIQHWNIQEVNPYWQKLPSRILVQAGVRRTGLTVLIEDGKQLTEDDLAALPTEALWKMYLRNCCTDYERDAYLKKASDYLVQSGKPLTVRHHRFHALTEAKEIIIKSSIEPLFQHVVAGIPLIGLSPTGIPNEGWVYKQLVNESPRLEDAEQFFTQATYATYMDRIKFMESLKNVKSAGKC